MCIGMTPNSKLLAEFSPTSVDPKTGFVKVKKTMQIADDRYPHIFAVGDVVDHTDVKTGHFAWMQGLSVLNNILKLINGTCSYSELEPYKSKDVALIKLILGEVHAETKIYLLAPLAR